MPPKRKQANQGGRASKRAKSDTVKESATQAKQVSGQRKATAVKAPTVATRVQPRRRAKDERSSLQQDGDNEENQRNEEGAADRPRPSGGTGIDDTGENEEVEDREEIDVDRARATAERWETAVDRAEQAANRLEAAMNQMEARILPNQVPAAVPAADSTSGSGDDPVDGWPEVDVLASAYHHIECSYQGADATMIVELEVHKDPDGFRSRLGYRARLSLIPPGETRSEQIGYIHSWRINKPSHQHKSSSNDPTGSHFGPVNDAWLSELLTIPYPTAHLRIKETALCMQTLYDENGVIREGVRHLSDELEDNSLIFIEMIYIFEKFQRQSLLRQALNGFYNLLMEVSEWFGFRGTVVLVPDRPHGVRGQVWGSRTSTQVQDRLRRIYNRVGYIDYIRGARVNLDAGTDVLVSVMGRTVHQEDFEDEDEDDGS